MMKIYDYDHLCYTFDQIEWTVYGIQCTLFIVQCIMYIVHYTIFKSKKICILSFTLQPVRMN